MAFADPQSVTVNAVAQSLPRTGITDTKGVFTKDDSEYQLQVTQTNNGKRRRQAIRLSHNKTEPDPLMPSVNTALSLSVTLVLDGPTVGYTNTEKQDILDGFVAYLSASSGAKMTQMIGGEL